MKNIVHIGMACQLHRIPNLYRSVPVLAKQCGRLFLHFNGCNSKKQLPVFKERNIVMTYSRLNYGDTKKLSSLNQFCHYYFTVDDDILYPANYVKEMLHVLKSLKDRAIVCVYGSTFDPAQSDRFFNAREKLAFDMSLDDMYQVLVPGTGTAAFKPSMFPIRESQILYPNMLDVWFACFAAQNHLPVYCVSRGTGWLKRLSDNGTSICANHPKRQINELVRKYRAVLSAMLVNLAEYNTKTNYLKC